MSRYQLPNWLAFGSVPIRKFQFVSKYVPVIGLPYGMKWFHSWNPSYSVCDLSARTQKPAWSGVFSLVASASQLVHVVAAAR